MAARKLATYVNVNSVIETHLPRGTSLPVPPRPGEREAKIRPGQQKIDLTSPVKIPRRAASTAAALQLFIAPARAPFSLKSRAER